MIEASTSDCLLLATALLWVQIEVIAQSVGNTITKPRTANVQRHRANAGCNFDQTISDYYKVNVLFTFVDHVVQKNRLKIVTTMAMSIESIDNGH